LIASQITLSVMMITNRQSYTIVDCRRPSFSDRCCLRIWNELPRHVTSRHICTMPESFLQSSQDPSLQPFVFCLFS